MENDFRKKNTEIARYYTKKDLRILADKDQLKQVFLNLFLNSLHAMDEKKQNLLNMKTLLYNSDLVIRIEDSGCGILQKDIPHVFEPFFTTNKNGSGLGLTIVKSIIENHNGKISVESVPLGGSAFTITLPFMDKK